MIIFPGKGCRLHCYNCAGRVAPRLRTGLMSQHPDDNYQCHGLQPDDTEKFNVNDTLITTHGITRHSTNNSIQYNQCRGLNLCCKGYNRTLYYSVQTLLLFLWYLNCLLGSGVFLRRFVEITLIRLGFVFYFTSFLFHWKLTITSDMSVHLYWYLIYWRIWF